MISARLEGNGRRPVVLLGIDDRNIERLKQGMPIKLDGSQVGLGEVDLAITYGKRLQDIVDDLARAGVDVPLAALEAAKAVDAA